MRFESNSEACVKKKIHLIAAARPNFMKIAPLYHALCKQDWCTPVIVHTGQHYDVNMSDAFFKDLQLPDPHIHLGVGSGSHAEQTGNVMVKYEQVIYQERPDMVVVVGDVNSTIACALAANKVYFTSSENAERGGDNASSRDMMHRPIVAHLEAGLRSNDRSMPEEINRITTDVLSDILWTPSPDADQNLLREGIDRAKIFCVGNIMIDSLEMLRDRIEAEQADKALGLTNSAYAVVTMHRPANVDNPQYLERLVTVIEHVSSRITLVFPVHPRTRKNLLNSGLLDRLEAIDNVHLLEPLNYIRFMSLVYGCRFVLTDSGGIQEETSYLGIPCLTLRPNTERPVTITKGTNCLCKLEEVEAKIDEILNAPTKAKKSIEYWDGATAHRVVDSIRSYMGITE